MNDDSPPRAALIGADGYGRWHRRVLAELADAGEITAVGLCDPADIVPAPDAPIPPGARLFRDYRRLLAETRPAVVVIATPPHTHVEIAAAAAEAGADLLLEKPPVTSYSEHVALAAVLAATGSVAQVGFQALGSAALAELTAALASGAYGRVTGVSAVGAWQRPDSYYRRAPWAGRRRLAGRPVLDGALANPFAHALMQCLAVAEQVGGGPPQITDLALERYCARPIEVDDTAVLRAELDGGLPMVVAVTLCADQHLAGEVIVHTERGPAVLRYTEDRLQLPGESTPRPVPGRTGLLANLLAHRSTGTPLLAPLARTEPFTVLISAITGAPPPQPLAPSAVAAQGEGDDRVVMVPGVSAVMQTAAEQLALPSELGVGWATTPTHCNISAYRQP
ncbi:Gfo/Idh/MocA family oxidoreductase [Natronosporangium hydrolyticum]|uniref:Gfo/Idh/MocA family oxidoreductase n=1 Tax=Natronosporangium hydrolyticum TaxID=2811111 RepID=A0A895YD93_9ACTN|nr:Gfo/Idh/MocA family oxidoreductase [Natronosporangium hydrolyticum]QSB15774.1 Gfo/Idh/MocA family oxidoreductase [Natronosporangium hydrolyticum]